MVGRWGGVVWIPGELGGIVQPCYGHCVWHIQQLFVQVNNELSKLMELVHYVLPAVPLHYVVVAGHDQYIHGDLQLWTYDVPLVEISQ